MATPDFVDTHVHFWDRSVPELGGYGWLDPGGDPHPALGVYDAVKMPRYWADDFVAETRFSRVVGVVHVQAAIGIPDPVAETRWLQAFADRLGVPNGIVAYVDLADPTAVDVLRGHQEFSCLCGVRDQRYDDYLTNEAWERGYQLLEGTGLVFCDDPAVEEMVEAAALAARHPDVVYCVDHAGFPKRRDDDYFAEWRSGMRRLAEVPNTVVKVSGLGMCDHTWTVASWRRWVLECIDAWGVDRAFFGTNWPVDRLFSSYQDVIDAYAHLVSDLGAEEQEQLFSRNAQRVFGLVL